VSARILLQRMESQDPGTHGVASAPRFNRVEEPSLMFMMIPIFYKEEGERSMNVVAWGGENLAFLIELLDLLHKKPNLCPGRRV
jgi:hypothetical protein